MLRHLVRNTDRQMYFMAASYFLRFQLLLFLIIHMLNQICAYNDSEQFITGWVSVVHA
jgi:hypothetical protein